MFSPRTALLLALISSARPALADEPRPAITIRLDEPDAQLQAILDLFRGSRAPNPAAALASWKRASREPGRLGKPLEALIAAFNPAMAGEVRLLDGAELALRFGPDGTMTWGASVPKDDGTFAALATSLVLSGGSAEPPIEGMAVDRLGFPGSALMARAPRALLIADSIAALKDARDRADRPIGGEVDPRHRPRFVIEAGALDGAGSTGLRMVRAALASSRIPPSGRVGLIGPAFRASVDLGYDRPVKPPVVDPAWLDWLPTDRAMAAFAVAVDPSPASWNSTFALADRVERSDPARMDLAPSRLRLDLLARARGLRTEVDLLPHLRGVSGWIGGDGRSTDRAVLLFHLADEAAARRIFEGLTARTEPGGPAEPGPETTRRLGRFEGRPVRLSIAGRSLAACWGDGSWEASVEARGRPGRSARAFWRDEVPNFVAYAWPARVPGLLPEGTPLAFALGETPPVVVSGGQRGPLGLRIEAEWGGLDGAVRRFLDLIPLDPPPDR